jgi:hypothetical protein
MASRSPSLSRPAPDAHVEAFGQCVEFSLDPMVEGFTPFANLDGGYVLAEIR